MPFIPHTTSEVRDMLSAIGVSDIEALFDEIPLQLRCGELEAVPEGMSEMEISRLMHTRASQDGQPLCFIGAGAYEHHIPAAVWEITTRGEYYSAYTPYQAEASQGTLQLIYEYQTMMCALTGMEVSNASLYDGASALAEAVLMAVRSHRKSESRRILMPLSVHPFYREVVRSIVESQNIELIDLAFDQTSGQTDFSALDRHKGEDITALVIPQPNFFGVLEDVDSLSDWARANNSLSIAVVNPVSLALLKPPGEWGTGSQGVDIVCGEGQPLGSPLSSGGPYFGFMCCRQEHVRQMPGRIVGRTLDLDGNAGFTLTLQPREQHIRRSKATSNICTNQGLLVTAATIHMSLLGPDGMRRVAEHSHANTRRLADALNGIEGVNSVFDGPCFHEHVIRLPVPADRVLEALAREDILGGYPVDRFYPELQNSLLICATETKTDEDIRRYTSALESAISQLEKAA